MPSSRQSVVNKSNNITNECENSSKFFYNLQKNGTSTRKQPLYHNCYLQAPDGETLCTCDRKKAEWYITKKLGVKIKDEPYIVRLNFEPSGRACGKVGQYYTQFKVNQCVVCGAQDKFMKKNIVPKEYRKYFPLIMKAHQSHDILLLCPTCHTMSNRNDLILRRELAMICDAPLSYTSPLMNNIYHRRRKFMSAEKALRLNNTSIPPHRIQELEARIIQYSQQNYINSHKSKYMEDVFDNKPFNNSYSEQNKSLPHGLKVVQYFTNCQEGGLVLLERMWRKHFIDTMHPKYLPQLWSLDHNQERLEIRINQNRIEPQDAKISGIIR